MTKLECSVENCVHNADQCCCRGSILVDGHGARDAEGIPYSRPDRGQRCRCTQCCMFRLY